MTDWFYRAFEDRYRGNRATIRDRLTVYLPFVQPLARPGAVALDLGCGRGEWIELLGETGFAAEGVDLDEGMLAACRERGLKVTNGDAVAVLRARPEASAAVVSAFHLVEHIPFDLVQTLIAEALRVLQPGGLLILETPNPENLVVGASSFYDDPSHLRPLPPKLLAFAVEHGGFARNNVLRLQEAAHLRGTGPVQLFDVLAGVSPDYAVVAQKSGAPAELASLDALFAATYGVDLHILAQRHQQGQDAVRDELEQVREQQNAGGNALQEQFARVGAQISHVHATTVSLAADLAGSQAAQSALAEQLALLAGPNGHGGNIESVQDRLTQELDRIETAAQAHAEQIASQLRMRIAEVQQMHEQAVGESARLAQHVAWVEGRLVHAEAELAALRRRGLAAGVVRALGNGRRLAGTGIASRLRQPARAFLRRLVQHVMRRPALKRVARTLVSRFPGLHTRLLQLMYAPASAATSVPVDTDPLASEMSPRSLSIYRALRGASKPKD